MLLVLLMKSSKLFPYSTVLRCYTYWPSPLKIRTKQQIQCILPTTWHVYVFKLKCCYACRIQIKHNTEQRILPHRQEIKAHLYHSATDDSAGTGEDKETPIHECLNAEKLLAMAGNSLTFFRVPLRNSLYWSDRR